MHNYTGPQNQENSTRTLTCTIVGARGYSGLELARLLIRHPLARLTHCFATTQFQLSDYLDLPTDSKITCLPETELSKCLNENPTDVYFLATPAEASLALAPKILQAGKKVIDLSGAFRLKKSSYPQWYKFDHSSPELLAQAQYGLCPWTSPKSADLVANPGCYATAITMGLIPLLKNQLIDPKSIVIDAKSGTSGAGKKASENMIFTEVEGDCLPYRVGKHQHLPEIIECIEDATGVQIDPFMTTSLLPVRRGIIAGIYANLNLGVTENQIQEAFAKAYSHYPLVSFGHCEKSQPLLSLRRVVGTGKTHLSYSLQGSKLYLFSCIDNLMKGAATQAIENFNRLNDQPYGLALSQLEATI